jgi:hypothetical protein
MLYPWYEGIAPPKLFPTLLYPKNKENLKTAYKTVLSILPPAGGCAGNAPPGPVNIN